MINFSLTFETNKNGFTPSQTQQDAMNLAATTWGQLFDHDATIDFLVQSVNNPNSDVLMSAGANFPTMTSTGFEDSEVVRTKVLTGSDTNGSESDGVIEVNWGINWELDINETPDTSVSEQEEFDFYSTFYHEIAHTLGFLSSIGKDGTDSDGEGITTPGSWTFFDQFITDEQGNPAIDPNTFQTNTALYIPRSTGGSSADGTSGLFFNGPKAVAANNNKPVGLYTPAQYEEGSSVSHLDDENPAFSDLLTLAAVDFGSAARTLDPVEKAIFEDLGYRFATSKSNDTTLPILTALTPNLEEITDSDAGDNAFALTLVFSEAMNTSIAPLISFPTKQPDTSLNFASGAWNNNDTTYTATYDIIEPI